MAKSIDEIAKLAAVSVTSVRLVINGQDKKYRISEKTRARIQAIIDEIGHWVDPAYQKDSFVGIQGSAAQVKVT